MNKPDWKSTQDDNKTARERLRRFLLSDSADVSQEAYSLSRKGVSRRALLWDLFLDWSETPFGRVVVSAVALFTAWLIL